MLGALTSLSRTWYSSRRSFSTCSMVTVVFSWWNSPVHGSGTNSEKSKREIEWAVRSTARNRSPVQPTSQAEDKKGVNYGR